LVCGIDELDERFTRDADEAWTGADLSQKPLFHKVLNMLDVAGQMLGHVLLFYEQRKGLFGHVKRFRKIPTKRKARSFKKLGMQWGMHCIFWLTA
jgi:hypothetical protein